MRYDSSTLIESTQRTEFSSRTKTVEKSETESEKPVAAQSKKKRSADEKSGDEVEDPDATKNPVKRACLSANKATYQCYLMSLSERSKSTEPRSYAQQRCPSLFPGVIGNLWLRHSL